MNREEIFEIPLARRPVETRAWGTVFVRQLRADELPALLEILDDTGTKRLARFCVLGCVDQHGQSVFIPGDETRLAELALEPISELATAFLEFNGIDGLEDEKKSPSTPWNTSSSVLPIDGASRSRK